MILRPYQQHTIDTLFAWLSANRGDPCVVIPTGGGKSIIIAHICKLALTNWPETRILMLTHVKELIEQNAEKMRAVWPGAPLGICSAGLGRKELAEPITFAGIQSVSKRGADIGHVDIILADEAHAIGHEEQGGYRTLIAELRAINPHMRVIGFTATPWRLGHGLITDKPAIFDDLIEPVTIEELIHKGFLAPLRSKMTEEQFDLSAVHTRGGEFVESELQAAVDTGDKNQKIAEEIIRRAEGRKAWLLFCAGVAHAEHMRDVLMSLGILSATVTGETPAAERANILRAFKNGQIRAVTNANVLTTGFDYPDIDLIALLRPTKSPTLFVQMSGRGLRPKSHTDHCLVLDFAGAVSMHGPITCVRPPEKRGTGKSETEAPAKTCPNCGEIVALSARICLGCGHEFPKVEHETRRHNDDIMGKDVEQTAATLDWYWSVHTARASGKKMLRVDYYLVQAERVSEYLTVAHEGFAGTKSLRTLEKITRGAGGDIKSEWGAALWCTLKGDALAKSLDHAAAYLNALPKPSSIVYVPDGKFFRVKERVWNVDEKISAPVVEQAGYYDDIPF